MSHVVPIQTIGGHPQIIQSCLNSECDCRLASTGETSEPDRGTTESTTDMSIIIYLYRMYIKNKIRSLVLAFF